ncbi:MAG: DNA translocase FtsK [Thermoanaerobaculia bacterium]|nr:DNA translocase FtsK [Thermoanaerobaculia bacterium]
MGNGKTSTWKLPLTPRLGPHKGRELAGLVLGALAALLAASLVSHNPADPSFLHQVPDAVRPENWIGAFGAQVSALLLGLFGLAAFLVPIGLAIPAWRLLRDEEGGKGSGRGLGFILLMASVPVFLQLLLETISWRGDSLDAGGVLGRYLAGGLRSQLNLGGAFLVTVSFVLIGLSLTSRATLGEMALRLRDLLVERFEQARTAWIRRKQHREKEKARARVVAKHLRRREEKAGEAGGVADSPGDELDLPLRVTEKQGEQGFAVRKVRKGTPGPASPETATAASPAKGSQRSKAQARLFDSDGADDRDRSLPPLNLLVLDETEQAVPEDELIRLGETIRRSCEEFGVEGTIEAISPGPVITVFEFKPAPGVKMSQIVNLQDDLALALKAESVRIDRLPGRSTLGIEVPNQDRGLIRVGSLLRKEKFCRSPSPLTMAIGLDIHGEPHFADLATMPHILVAGATGSGKSVGLQSMITSILYKATREEVQFILIDPKRVELGVYKDIPHLKTEVVIEPKKAANALRWAVAEMERRYRLLAEVHVRSIDYYNRAICDPEVQKRLSLDEDSEITQEDLKPLPYYVIVIDELADLMLVAASDVEASIARLAQMARAVGIHLIIATQRPSVDVITGTIKANFPCRMAFATTSRHDSKTILDTVGAERLLGNGDLLLMPPGSSRLKRLHGAYISEQETAALIRWLKRRGKPDLDPEVVQYSESSQRGGRGGVDEEDELYDEAARIVVSERKGSASFLQRRLRIGFSRASRLIDMMAQEGIVGPPQGSKPRDVLVGPDFFEEVDQQPR